MNIPLQTLFKNALAMRSRLLDERYLSACRLFNGFTEGLPGLAVDLYAASLVIHNLADPPEELGEAVDLAQKFYPECLPWIQAIILKTRHAESMADKRGRLVFGAAPANRVLEHDTWYALDLLMQQDASLYLDTRNLRKWAIENLAGKSVLNTFAYTGSLGVAALKGSASRVVQLDRNRDYLNLAKTSCTLNGFPIRPADFISADFWQTVSRLKRDGELFDCIFLDPPFFAASPRGTLDLQRDSPALVNKLRPLVRDGGRLVIINNALFLSGADHLRTLEQLCAGGYLEIETLIPVPEDITGFAGTIVYQPPADPAPFNHSTKMAVLKVRRKNA
jgi:23S rRNA (cytosine1962-C5)-methyltransferase